MCLGWFTMVRNWVHLNLLSIQAQLRWRFKSFAKLYTYFSFWWGSGNFVWTSEEFCGTMVSLWLLLWSELKRVPLINKRCIRRMRPEIWHYKGLILLEGCPFKGGLFQAIGLWEEEKKQQKTIRTFMARRRWDPVFVAVGTLRGRLTANSKLFSSLKSLTLADNVR